MEVHGGHINQRTSLNQLTSHPSPFKMLLVSPKNNCTNANFHSAPQISGSIKMFLCRL